jgi:hypothetical protein
MAHILSYVGHRFTASMAEETEAAISATHEITNEGIA